MILPNLSGSHPIRLKFSDGSEQAYELDSPILRTAVARGGKPLDPEAAQVQKDQEGGSEGHEEDTVVLADIEYPLDLQCTLGDYVLTKEEVVERFAAFIKASLTYYLSLSPDEATDA